MAYFTSVYKSELPHWAKSVYMYLHGRTNKDGKCYTAIGTIARELNLSRSPVKRASSDLEKGGYLKKNSVSGKTAARAVICIFLN